MINDNTILCQTTLLCDLIMFSLIIEIKKIAVNGSSSHQVILCYTAEGSEVVFRLVNKFSYAIHAEYTSLDKISMTRTLKFQFIYVDYTKC